MKYQQILNRICSYIQGVLFLIFDIYFILCDDNIWWTSWYRFLLTLCISIVPLFHLFVYFVSCVLVLWDCAVLLEAVWNSDDVLANDVPYHKLDDVFCLKNKSWWLDLEIQLTLYNYIYNIKSMELWVKIHTMWLFYSFWVVFDSISDIQHRLLVLSTNSVAC